MGVVEYNVTERHGWWDDNTKRLVNEVVTLNAESGEGYTSYDIALKRYSDQKQHRAQEGFVHLFRREIPSGQEVYVRLTGA